MVVSTSLRRLSMALAVLGLIISGYLTWSHLTNSSLLCTGVGGCDAVRQSIYSEVGGIPVAALGLIGFIGVVGCLLLEEGQSAFAQLAPIMVLGLSLVGVLYSAYLTYLELFVIQAICPYCVASALLMAAIFGIAVYRALFIQPDEG